MKEVHTDAQRAQVDAVVSSQSKQSHDHNCTPSKPVHTHASRRCVTRFSKRAPHSKCAKLQAWQRLERSRQHAHYVPPTLDQARTKHHRVGDDEGVRLSGARGAYRPQPVVSGTALLAGGTGVPWMQCEVKTPTKDGVEVRRNVTVQVHASASHSARTEAFYQQLGMGIGPIIGQLSPCMWVSRERKHAQPTHRDVTCCAQWGRDIQGGKRRLPKILGAEYTRAVHTHVFRLRIQG